MRLTITPRPAMQRSLALGLCLLAACSRRGRRSPAPTRPATRLSWRLIKGQEQYLHVWTLGEKGVGDESDKLVTIDVIPGSQTYGKVIHTLSVGGRGEAHHMGFTDDRKYLWTGRLDDSKIFIFDVGTDPGKPALVRTIDNLAEATGYVGPHRFTRFRDACLCRRFPTRRITAASPG